MHRFSMGFPQVDPPGTSMKPMDSGSSKTLGKPSLSGESSSPAQNRTSPGRSAGTRETLILQALYGLLTCETLILSYAQSFPHHPQGQTNFFHSGGKRYGKLRDQ